RPRVFFIVAACRASFRRKSYATVIVYRRFQLSLNFGKRLRSVTARSGEWDAALTHLETNTRLSRPPLIEMRGIIYHQSPPGGVGRRHLGDDVDQLAVVRGGSLVVGMRPVGAPDTAVGKLGDELACKGHGVGVKRAGAADPVAAADLHPELAVPHQLQQ